MSMQLNEKKRRGPAMSSTAKITKGDASEDALLTESALLTNAGGGAQDEQGEALFIPEKTEVGEKMINETGVAVKRAFPAARQKMAYESIGGKRRAPTGTAARRIAAMAATEEELKKAQNESVITEDPYQLKILQRGECCCHWYRQV